MSDWALDAAHEIMTEASGHDTEQTAAIIRKHQPRCATCRYWMPLYMSLTDGICDYGSNNDEHRKLWADAYDNVLTEHDFGCTQWEAK